ncbi:MAG: succinylglutamate desuccinylase/aspartoacylase family protein [Sphingomonadales bacterium]|nr:succinylglutamate desuccinylase/aspartoacylase family protein [Sphingomonadales bacterium]
MARAAFQLAGQNVAAGKAEKIAIPVSDLSAGMQAQLEARIFHGKEDGPVIFVSGAIHGDEIIGTEIIRRLMKKLNPKHIAGTILFVPVVNMYGFISHSRYLPDRRDLNRSFPGSERGSLASQLASIFYTEIVTKCELGIDIHSAAIHRYNLPQIRIAAGNARLKKLALEFGAPALIEAPLRDGSLREIAKGDGVDMLLLEAGEGLRFDELSIRTGVNGILRVMRQLGMIKTKSLGKIPAPPAQVTKDAWLRASRGGVCRLQAVSGDAFKKGDTLAIISDIFGQEEEKLIAPADGIIIGHATLPIVNQGDAILHIAEVRIFAYVEERMDAINDAVLSNAMLDEDEVI